jgi:hypothetical protein
MSKKTNQTQGDGFSQSVLDATDEGALDAVQSVGADEQADLVDAWVARGNVAAVARVAREDDAPAPARKAARRGLNVLKSRGVRVPEKANVVRPLAEKIVRTLDARMLPPDGSGASVFTLFSRASGKDTHVVDVVVVENVGVVRVSGGMLSSGRLREWENESKRTRGFAPAPVSVEYARWRVARAREQNQKSNVPAPLELESYTELLEPPPATEPSHPCVVAGLDLSPADGAGRVEKSASLHGEPELRGYLPTRAALQELLVKLGERVASGGKEQPTNDAFAAYLKEEVAAAADRFFIPEIRDLVGARMLDAAASILARSGKERALDVLATRDALLKAGLITQPPREIPFCRAFFDKAIAALAQQSGGRLDIPLPAQAAGGGTGPVLSADQLAAIDAARGEGTSPTP